MVRTLQEMVKNGIDWQSLLMQIKPKLHDESELPLPSIQAFSLLKDLANDPRRHFVFTSASAQYPVIDYLDVAQRERWNSIGSRQWVAWCEVYRRKNGDIKVGLMVATKASIEDQPLQMFSVVDDVDSDCAIYFGFNFVPSKCAGKFGAVEIEDRGVTRVLRRQGVMRRLTHDFLNSMKEYFNDQTEISSVPIAPATYLDLSHGIGQYEDKKRQLRASEGVPYKNQTWYMEEQTVPLVRMLRCQSVLLNPSAMLAGRLFAKRKPIAENVTGEEFLGKNKHVEKYVPSLK